MARKHKKSNTGASKTNTSSTGAASARGGRRKKFSQMEEDYNDNYDEIFRNRKDDNDGNDLVDVLSDTFTMFSEDASLFDDPFHENDDMEQSNEMGQTASNNFVKQEQQQQQLQNHHAKLLQCIHMATSLCSEKRSATRERGLKVLFRGITQYAMGEMGQETIQDRLYTDIVPICLNGLRGSGGGGGSTPAEQYASCRILEATSILLGGGGGGGEDDVAADDDYVQAIRDPLIRFVKVTHRAVQVRRAALRALAMACFMGSWTLSYSSSMGGEEMDTTGRVSEELEIVMDLCEDVGKEEFRGERVDSRLRATAWECWALLATLLGDACLAGDVEDEDGYYDDYGSGDYGGSGEEEEYDDDHDNDDDVSNGSRRRRRWKRRGVMALPALSECLDSAKDLELRCAVGGCLALIHEARLKLGMKGKDGENASERRYAKGSWDGSEWEVTMDEIKQRIAELSVESGKHMSKKVKKDQRATFREFLSTIVDDDPPREVVTFRGGQLTLTTWREIIQLNFIRLCLQTGFQIQLMTNETLQMIFGADASILNTITQLSQLEKRHTQSKTSEASKQAYNERNKSRKSKMRAKYSFLEADGDEF